VTTFFRHPEAFEALKAKALRRLLEDRGREDTIRVWVPCCASGEEVYSLAIALTEYVAESGGVAPLTIYATDLDDVGIRKARSGLFPKTIAEEVSPQRLRRFFIEMEGGYRIAKAIRDVCIFARHDVLGDPPLSRMDLISCRNDTACTEPRRKPKLLRFLHYALKPAGILFLGPSADMDLSLDLFEVEDGEAGIYSKRMHAPRLGRAFPLGPYTPTLLEAHAGHVTGGAASELEEKDKQINRLLQELSAARGYLQSIIEQQESANEQLQSANEDAQSANEELQSINEELETSREEIQSSNEELTSLNEELQSRNEELHRVNNDLNNLFGGLQMAIVMVWQDLKIRRFTPAAERLFNLIATDIGRPIGDIKPNLLVRDLPRLIGEAIGQAAARELEVRDKAGRRYQLRIRPYRTLANRVDGAVILLFDIESLKQSQEVLERQANDLAHTHEALRGRVAELAEADRHKSEFLVVLAHELRNPLAPLRNGIEIMKSLPAADPRAGRARELVERQARTLARLVDDLLDTARINRGQVQLRRETLDLQLIVMRAAETARDAIDSRRHRLTVSLPAETLDVVGDATRLEQVLANLLHNAAKYTPEGGDITVSAAKTNGGGAPEEVTVSIRDTGIGMSEEMLPRVFDLFVQADRSLAHTQGGLGIGLSLVRSLIELHGGRVAARSEGLGKGSEFSVYLPLAPISEDRVEGRGAARS
jgi:signal transduction histidine kinase/chemotaxis methyl-accepting protein methylase/outer membrane murein-binding lipoprotein Lpp